MKKYLLIFLFISSYTFSQSNGITYQAVIYNPRGEQLPGANNPYSLITNQQVCIQFGIVDANGSLEYQENVQVVTDGFGMVNVLIGAYTQTAGYATGFNNVNWGPAAKFLKVDINLKGECVEFEELSYQPFTYVPFAYYSPGSDIPGPQGIQGEVGPQGETGATGAQGEVGPQGETGATGAQGSQGIQGEVGPQGETGATGAQGIQGEIGPQGETGATGAQGEVGPQGETGATGAQGSQGIQGEVGPQGETGATGAQGETGATGAQGSPGINGENGQDGINGLSAYEIWISLGNTGTEQEFIDSLVGPAGSGGNSGSTNFTNGIPSNIDEYTTCNDVDSCNLLIQDGWVPFGGISIDESRAGTGGNTYSYGVRQAMIKYENSPIIDDYRIAASIQEVTDNIADGFIPFGGVSYTESRAGTGGSNFSKKEYQAMILLSSDNDNINDGSSTSSSDSSGFKIIETLLDQSFTVLPSNQLSGELNNIDTDHIIIKFTPNYNVYNSSSVTISCYDENNVLLEVYVERFIFQRDRDYSRRIDSSINTNDNYNATTFSIGFAAQFINGSSEGGYAQLKIWGERTIDHINYTFTNSNRNNNFLGSINPNLKVFRF